MLCEGYGNTDAFVVALEYTIMSSNVFLKLNHLTCNDPPSFTTFAAWRCIFYTFYIPPPNRMLYPNSIRDFC